MNCSAFRAELYDLFNEIELLPILFGYYDSICFTWISNSPDMVKNPFDKLINGDIDILENINPYDDKTNIIPREKIYVFSITYYGQYIYVILEIDGYYNLYRFDLTFKYRGHIKLDDYFHCDVHSNDTIAEFYIYDDIVVISLNVQSHYRKYQSILHYCTFQNLNDTFDGLCDLNPTFLANGTYCKNEDKYIWYIECGNLMKYDILQKKATIMCSNLCMTLTSYGVSINDIDYVNNFIKLQKILENSHQTSNIYLHETESYFFHIINDHITSFDKSNSMTMHELEFCDNVDIKYTYCYGPHHDHYIMGDIIYLCVTNDDNNSNLITLKIDLKSKTITSKLGCHIRLFDQKKY